MTVDAAILDYDTFWRGYERLNASTLELTEFTSTRLEGTVNCDRDGLLYTSIPQNGNWHVSVDGREAETVLVGDCMTAVELSEGEHEIVFTYRNRAFSLGWKVSVLCFGAFLALTAKPGKKKQGKFEK